MSDFILLQHYARNFLLRYFMSQPDVLDVEPGFKGKLDVIATRWRGSMKVVAREKTGRSLLVDPKWESEGATVLAVYLLDSKLFWFIDAPKLSSLVQRNKHLLEERYGTRVLPWTAVTQHFDGQLVDIRGLSYLSFCQYRELHTQLLWVFSAEKCSSPTLWEGRFSVPEVRYGLKKPAHQSSNTRQSPVTDIRTLTVLVLESYEQTFVRSSPKVHKRHEKLLSQLKARR